MTGKDDLESLLANLKRTFDSGLEQRFAEMDSAFENVRNGNSADQIRKSLRTLEALSHKLVGAAGTYGLTILSDTASELEMECANSLEREKTPKTESLREIERLLYALKGTSRR